MPSLRPELPSPVARILHAGTVIPAHPLALDAERRFDERHMRALTRYYLDAGAGGLAVGVHTTQFAIREAGLYRPVLEQVMASLRDWTTEPRVMIAGICGPTRQAVEEARIARDLGYHAGLLSLAALRGADEERFLVHCREVAQVLPLVGFYLQPAVGGIRLPASFWRRFFALEGVVAVKVAPFDRYATLEVLQGLIDAGAEARIALYTGNDDHILPDLLLPFRLRRGGEDVELRFPGGLLGHWAVWSERAVDLHRRCREAAARGEVPADLLALDAPVTTMNAALFDVANGFAGCIAGIQHVLWRQGLLASPLCLDPRERLSPGQREAIERVRRLWPELLDDGFVAANRARWLE